VQARLTKVVFCGGSSLYGEDLYGRERCHCMRTGNGRSPKTAAPAKRPLGKHL
jgi:hypothetical protein